MKNHILSYIKDSNQHTGATLLEYVLVAALLGVVLIGSFVLLQPGAESLHNEAKDGLFFPYPENYLQPTPRPSPTP